MEKIRHHFTLQKKVTDTTLQIIDLLLLSLYYQKSSQKLSKTEYDQY